MTTTERGSTPQRPMWVGVQAGDVITVDFGVPVGSEPGFTRPAVVLTANLVLQARPRTLHVVPLTSNTVRSLPTDLEVEAAGLTVPSVAQCHRSTTVSSERVANGPDGNIGPAALAAIRSIVGDLLDIG